MLQGVVEADWNRVVQTHRPQQRRESGVGLFDSRVRYFSGHDEPTNPVQRVRCGAANPDYRVVPFSPTHHNMNPGYQRRQALAHAKFIHDGFLLSLLVVLRPIERGHCVKFYVG